MSAAMSSVEQQIHKHGAYHACTGAWPWWRRRYASSPARRARRRDRNVPCFTFREVTPLYLYCFVLLKCLDTRYLKYFSILPHSLLLTHNRTSG